MLKIETLIVGALQTNCYLAWCSETKEGLVIDPGEDGEYIIGRIQALQIKPTLIVATHGHFDHVVASMSVKMAFNLPFLIHDQDRFLLTRAQASARHWLGVEVDPPAVPDDFLKSDQLIQVGNQQLKVIHTPGHTPGSVCLYEEEESIMFTGDTLFADAGVGRTDFAYSSDKDLRGAIKSLFQLPDNVKIYPGHGSESTLGEERDFHTVS